jgi:polysaccharide biosynthesis protein PslH
VKILQICHKPPLPAVDGGCMAMNAIRSGLIESGHKVKVLAISTPKHPFCPDAISADYIKETDFKHVLVDTNLKPAHAIKNLLTKDSYNIIRFYSKKFEETIKATLIDEIYDLIILESLFVAPYIPVIKQFSNVRLILRTHNIEHLIWQRLSEKKINLAKRAYLKLLTKRLKKYELDTVKKVDAIAAISQNDADFFSRYTKSPVVEIPFGLKIDELPLPEAPSLFFIGSFDWMPNLEGIEWFLNKVWPLVLEKNPTIRLNIAGKKMPMHLLSKKLKNVNFLGKVESSRDFMYENQIMIVPLFSGSGIRVKILEAMSRGRIVISTPIGAEGIHYTQNENILIASSPEEFAQAIVKCYQNHDFCKNICSNALSLIKNNYSENSATNKLLWLYESLNPKFRKEPLTS